MPDTRRIGRTWHILPIIIAVHAVTLPHRMVAAQQPQRSCQPTNFLAECSADGTWSAAHSNRTWAQCAPKQCYDLPTAEGVMQHFYQSPFTSLSLRASLVSVSSCWRA